MRRAKRLILPLLCLVVGGIGYWFLSQEPDPPERPKREPRYIRTTATTLSRCDFRPTIETLGVVRPHTEAVLTAEITGRINSVSESLQDGAFFEKDEVLLTLSHEDFKAEVVSAQAALAQSQSALAQEEARGEQAIINWKNLGYDEEPSDLVKRLPQLREAQANVDAAEAALERAKRDLERTQIRAPFAGRVLQRSAALGQTISPNTQLATIVKTTSVEVRLPVSARQQQFLNLPESREDPPISVVITDGLNPDNKTVWKGQIVGTEGALDPETRELFAIATIEDPFSRDVRKGQPPIRIGQPVVAKIKGSILENVFVIPRNAVRKLDEIVLIDRESMTISRKMINPIWTDRQHIVIRPGTLPDQSLLATTRLVYYPDGAKVEIIPTETEAISKTLAVPGSKGT